MSRRKANTTTASPETETVGIRTTPPAGEATPEVLVEKHEVNEEPIFETYDELLETGQSHNLTVVKGGREARTMSGVLLYRGE